MAGRRRLAVLAGLVIAVATGPRSAVWSDGIKRFPGATPVTAVYDKDGKPRLYVWAPKESSPSRPGRWATTCNARQVFQVCTRADYSSIVVVSPQPPGDADLIVTGPVASITE